jgi:hypothetical protein
VKWISVNERLPAERKFVLWQFAPNDKNGYPAAVVVGYLRYAAGDKNSPNVIVPGGHPRTLPMYWADCLGDDFDAPSWRYVRELRLSNHRTLTEE